MRAETLRTLAAAATALLLVSPLLAYLAGFWDEYWKVVTNLGDEPAYVALATLIYVGVSRELGVTALLALISTAWLNVLVKNVLALPRPPRELWKVEASGYGFPSGHTQTSTTFWLSVGLKLRDAYVLALGLAVALLVGASRVELGVHYPPRRGRGLPPGRRGGLAGRQGRGG
jgi:membrane-associated phospholipid phosphatase